MKEHVVAAGVALLLWGCTPALVDRPLLDPEVVADPEGQTCGRATAAVGAADGWQPLPDDQSRKAKDDAIVAAVPDWFGPGGVSLVEIDAGTGRQTVIAVLAGSGVLFAVSLDGSQIAVALERQVNLTAYSTELTIMSRDGSETRDVYSAREYISALSWSHDGRYVAFIADQVLRRVDTEDDSVVSITDAPSPSIAHEYHKSAWSPDGSWILFTIGVYSTTVRVAPDGSDRRIFAHSGDFAFSPNPLDVAFEHPTGVSVAHADGTELRHLIAGLGHHLSWSPRGDAIAFLTSDDQDNELVCIISAAGTLETLAPCVKGPFTPGWSEDGEKLLIIETVSSGECRASSDFRLSVVNVATGAISRLTDEPVLDPVWAPGSVPLTRR